jgi:hypothetical protein
LICSCISGKTSKRPRGIHHSRSSSNAHLKTWNAARVS